jgi:DNA cross-link repair 1A protein
LNQFFSPIKTAEKVVPIEKVVPTEVKKTTRTCPFYKRLEGTQIVVDAFSYGNIDNCNAYFLSHYHYDHFVGLTRHFENKMFCSKVTANLVISQLKVNISQITVLEMNKFSNVYENDSIQVCLIDANHCPGSVMFLFRFKNTGRYVLHTGDFRACPELVENALFRNIKIDTIHLDTTYCNEYYKFLPQSKVIEIGVDLAIAELKKQPKALIVCGAYTIGKERVFIAIAEKLQSKIYVTKEKKKIIDCLENDNFQKMLTLDPNEAGLHVIPMGKLNIKDLTEHLDKFPAYNYLIAIKPTGWTHKEDASNSTNQGYSIEKKAKNVIIYGLEYSEHSSFDELKNCISTLKPRKIIPHVNVAKKEVRDKMQAYFNEWTNIKRI